VSSMFDRCPPAHLTHSTRRSGEARMGTYFLRIYIHLLQSVALRCTHYTHRSGVKKAKVRKSFLLYIAHE